MKRILQTEELSGFETDVGQWLWALEEVRSRTLKLVTDLDQSTLDWQGTDGSENSIGSLLYHIGLVEMLWLYMDILLQDFPSEVKANFPFEMAIQGRVTPVLQVPLIDHIERLAWSRAVFLESFQSMSSAEWKRLRHPPEDDYSVSPAWAVFHLIEHEAGHAAQISSLKARAARISR